MLHSIDPTGVIWRKSTRSNASGNCVEVATNIAHQTGRVLVRDTKDQGSGPVLTFSVDEWNAFTGGARDGEFDV